MKFANPTRYGLTHKFAIHSPAGRIKGYLTANTNPDTGTLGEIFIHLDNSDEALRGMTRTMCLILSKCLQRGIPLADLLSAMRHQRFEPAGVTEHPAIHFCSSLSDYIAQWITHQFTAAASEPTATTHPAEAGPAAARTTQTSTGDTHVAQTKEQNERT
jgi:ribonucleoside-diphosphate reductase alpha chain